MKSISLIIISCIAAISSFAQNIYSTVTVQINGNRNRQIMVDGRSYSMSDYSTTSQGNNNNTTDGVIIITDLQLGQHTLQLQRNSQSSNRRNNATSTFSLRPGYDMLITVNGDGTLQLKESRHRGNRRSMKTPMSNPDFTAFYQNIQRQGRTNSRISLLSNAFANTGNYFTTQQVSQLISLISGENNRLQLAEASYRGITDPSNFTTVYQLLSNQSSRNALAAYVSSYNQNNPDYNNNGGYNNGGYNNNNNNNNNSNNNNNNNNNNNGYSAAMSDANFNIVMQDVQKQWLPGAKMSALTNTFANTSYYFSTNQAKQLIQLISEEPNRLQLAKASLRSIVDPANFTQIYEVLNSQESRNELAAYVGSYNNGSTYNNNNHNNTNNNNYQYKSPMSDANYNIVMQDVQKQWLPGAKMSALTNTFANTSYYFSTNQAKQLIQLISEEPNRLQLAKASLRSIVDPANFTQIYEVLNSQASRNELAAYVGSYNNGSTYNNNNNNTNNNNYQYKSPMSDARFNIVMQDVQKQWLPNAKVSTMANAFANTGNFFTTYQAKQLIQLINDEGNRLQLAKVSYRSIVDPNNFTQLYDLLNNQASRNELASYVSNYNNSNTGYTNVTSTNDQYKTAMTDANFNALVQQVESQWLPGAKMSALTNMFANNTYFFTTAQTRQLINYVTDEANRLQLAKSSYRGIVDPGNFPQLYDLFTSQASRDELTAYVNAYR